MDAFAAEPAVLGSFGDVDLADPAEALVVRSLRAAFGAGGYVGEEVVVDGIGGAGESTGVNAESCHEEDEEGEDGVGEGGGEGGPGGREEGEDYLADYEEGEEEPGHWRGERPKRRLEEEERKENVF